VSRLFRDEALQARPSDALGATILRPPVSFTAWCGIAACLSATMLAFLFVGEYTKRTRVVGVTVPSAGVLKLASPQAGIVIERHVEEGDRVTAGQVLFVLSSERMTPGDGSGAGAQTAILEQLRRRQASLVEELGRRSQLLGEQLAASQRRLADLQQEAAQIGKEHATQAAREASAAAQVRRYEGLAWRGFVSPLASDQKRDDLLDQTARRQAIERSLLAVRREVAAANAELRQMPLQWEQRTAEVQRELAALEQEIVGTEAARRLVVVAPKDGVVTAILAERGQAVGVQPLATLLPSGAPLEAHLFAPSRAIGFIEPGQSVRIRYAAYPFQKFGLYDGVVTHVSRTPLAPSELPSHLALAVPAEGLYRITVRLATSHVMTYGQEHALAAGMQLEADVMQDRRRLIEWALEPLIALRRKV
jgi:membrane fusion protein